MKRAITKYLFLKEKFTIFKDALKGFHHFVMKFFYFGRAFHHNWTILKIMLLINASSSLECLELMLNHKTNIKHYKKLQIIVQKRKHANGFWELDVNFTRIPIQFSQYVYNNNNKLVFAINSHSCEHLRLVFTC